MKEDLLVIPETQGTVTFSVRGKSPDSGLLLLQRIYVLMLSDSVDSYRSGSSPIDLLSILEGANLPQEEAMTSLLSAVCAATLELLDREDRNLIQRLSGVYSGGVFTLTLQLKDGTTVKGLIGNA